MYDYQKAFLKRIENYDGKGVVIRPRRLGQTMSCVVRAKADPNLLIMCTGKEKAVALRKDHGVRAAYVHEHKVVEVD